MTGAITSSMLRDLVLCERRVHHDLHSPLGLRDQVNPFVQLLWEDGIAHECSVLNALAGDVADLRETPRALLAEETRRAMASGASHILGGLVAHEDRLGVPDLMERRNGAWVAGDVKSGRATEADGRRPRREYAVQVGHYASILHSIGAGPRGEGFVIGRDGEPTPYDLTAPWDRGGRTLIEIGDALTTRARDIRDRLTGTRGAASAACKLCHWHTVCERELADADDLTLVAGVGRAARDALAPIASTVRALADLDPLPSDGEGGSGVPGLGLARLVRFRDRARLLLTPGATAYAIRPLGLVQGHREIHFDIETDPMRDGLVYLHGFLVREPSSSGFDARYHHVFAETPEQEGEAFAKALEFLTADPSAHIYYYSKYERSAFRKLADRHPEVCSREVIEDLFDPARATDLLFDVIMPGTEWPTSNLSIKTLARSLGFDWQDVDAGGAASITWFDEYARTSDPAVKQRILAYNRDDVLASAVVLDGLRALPLGGPPAWPPAVR